MVLPAVTLITATISSLLDHVVLLDRFVPMLVVVMRLLQVAICRIFIFQCSGVPLSER